MKRTPIPTSDLQGILTAQLPSWAIVEAALQREFTFTDFRQAFAFLTYLALNSERLDHHAEIWNVYNKVRVRLNTHEPKGISSLDVEMALTLERYLNR